MKASMFLIVALLLFSSCASSRNIPEPTRAQIEQDYQKEVNQRKSEPSGTQQRSARVIATVALILLLL